MARIPQLKPEELTAAQRAVLEARGGANLTGPTGVWIRVPELAAHAGGLTHYLRKGIVEFRLFELMCLIVARQWSSQYVFWVDEPQALQGGLTRDVVDAIRARIASTTSRV